MTLVVAVVGPTATGKSDLGLALAHALDGEVVNADAMQLYRGMDIGTAKLTVEERQGVPHHLLDVLDVQEDASVADYQARARAALQDIAARGARAVAVGGSGLYVRIEADQVAVYTEHTVDYEHGVSDAQLDLHVTGGIASALRFFAELDEKYPDAVTPQPTPQAPPPVSYSDPARPTID